MPKPESYPFHRIAKQFNVDYGDVLLLADYYRDGDWRRDGPGGYSWHHEPRACELEVLGRINTKEVVGLYDAINDANSLMQSIQLGKIDWQTGERIHKPRGIGGSLNAADDEVSER